MTESFIWVTSGLINLVGSEILSDNYWHLQTFVMASRHGNTSTLLPLCAHRWLFTKEPVTWSFNVLFACTRCWTQSPNASCLRHPDTHVMSLQWCFSMVNWRVVCWCQNSVEDYHFDIFQCSLSTNICLHYDHFITMLWCGVERNEC